MVIHAASFSNNDQQKLTALFSSVQDPMMNYWVRQQPLSTRATTQASLMSSKIWKRTQKHNWMSCQGGRGGWRFRIAVRTSGPPRPTPAFPFNVMAFPINVIAFPINVIAFPINVMAFLINGNSEWGRRQAWPHSMNRERHNINWERHNMNWERLNINWERHNIKWKRRGGAGWA